MNYSEEQDEIIKSVDIIRQHDSPGSWYKFNGDAVSRIVMEHIDKHVKAREMKVAGPNAFIDGFSTEFDLLITGRNAEPKPHTNSYKPEDVHIAIEVKTSGMFGGKKTPSPDGGMLSVVDDVKKNYENMVNKFKDTQEKNPKIKLAYLSIHEQNGGVRKGKDGKYGMDYIALAHKISEENKNVGAFILSNNRTTPVPCPGEWKSFVQFISEPG